jgi:hypothetical protein
VLHLRIVLGLTTIAMLSISAPSAAHASATRQGGPFPDLAELEGMQAGVNRSYSLDFDALEMVPEGSPAAGQPAYRDVLNLTGFVLEFDTAANAATGYDAFLDYGTDSLQMLLDFDNPTITEGDVAGLGDHAYAYSIFNQAASTEGYFRHVIVQHDTYIFLAIIITESEASSLDADALLATFVEAANAGHSGTGTFDEAGGSSGGLWAFFPPADHELYRGMVVTGDEIMYPM